VPVVAGSNDRTAQCAFGLGAGEECSANYPWGGGVDEVVGLGMFESCCEFVSIVVGTDEHGEDVVGVVDEHRVVEGGDHVVVVDAVLHALVAISGASTTASCLSLRALGTEDSPPILIPPQPAVPRTSWRDHPCFVREPRHVYRVALRS